MFTIDLLKGQGVPAKSKPEGIAVAAVTLAVPIVVAILVFGLYVSNSIAISIQKQEITGYEAKINEFSDALELQKLFEKERIAIGNCLSEVSSSIGRHTQWSPVLLALVESMPDSMVLTKLEVKERLLKREITKKDDAQTKREISVPARTLRISLSGNPRYNCDRAVRLFRDRLRFSTVLGPKLESVRISEQDFGEPDGEKVVSYEIDCIFKPEL